MSGETAGIVFIVAGVLAAGAGIAAVIINPAFWPTRWLIWGSTLAIELVCFAIGISLLMGSPIGAVIGAAVAVVDGVMLFSLQPALRQRFDARGRSVE